MEEVSFDPAAEKTVCISLQLFPFKHARLISREMLNYMLQRGAIFFTVMEDGASEFPR